MRRARGPLGTAFETVELAFAPHNREDFEKRLADPNPARVRNARAMLKAKVMLVSHRMPPELGKKLMFEQYPDMESALEMAFKRHGVAASIAIMPKASSTIPRVEAAF
jgi:nickel-dependent lactate racemase